MTNFAPRCDACPLNKRRPIKAPVLPAAEADTASGGGRHPRVRLILVGEPIGPAEEQSGEVFAHRPGRDILAHLKMSGIAPEEVFRTSATLCRADNFKQAAVAAECCAPRVLSEIAAVHAESPKAPVVTFGPEATKAVINFRNLNAARGFVWTHFQPKSDTTAKALSRSSRNQKLAAATRLAASVRLDGLQARALIDGVIVLPTLAPTFALGVDLMLPILRFDMQRAVKIARDGLPSRLDDDAPYVKTHLVADLYRLGPEVSCDIETDGIKPQECGILCVGFSDGSQTVVLHPWRDEMGPAVAQFMRSRKSVSGHNFVMFDQQVMAAHGVSFDGVDVHDTLLAHHAYASHMPQRLDWCVSEFLVSSPWKVAHGRRGGAGDEKGSAGGDVTKLPVDELAQYNAADCVLTSRIRDRMAAKLLPETATYQADLKLANLCREMGAAGIGIDFDRKYMLSRALREAAGGIRLQLQELVGDSKFEPSKVRDVERILYDGFRTRITEYTPGGRPSTASLTLEALKSDDTPAGRFAGLVLDWRVLLKVRSTYIGGETPDAPLKFDNFIGRDGRAHFNWKPFGTVSGRLSCRLQSCPRWDGTKLEMRAREIYVPRPGYTYVYFDVSQAEMRLAAYLSADENFIKACGGDVHAGNAKAVFTEADAKGWLDGKALKDPQRGKPFRDIAKNLGFAICYGAEVDKIYATLRSQGFAIQRRAVELILRKLRTAYATYYSFVDANVEAAKRTGTMRSPILGRLRHFGYYPKATEISNFPVQSALADLMNARTLTVMQRAPAKTLLVAQVHDADTFECRTEAVPELQDVIRKVWAEPVRLVGGDLILPVDLKTAERWSDL